MILTNRSRTLSAVIFAAVTLASAAASAQTKLDMVAFGGTSNLPIWIAIDRGLFAKEGIEIKLDQTGGSSEQMKDVMAGKYGLASTSVDNIIAYHEGQATTNYDGYDLIGVGGVSSVASTVVARPEIKGFADLKGKNAAVDSPSSGFGFVLYKILEMNGLKKDQDYTVVSVGGGPARLNALKDSKAMVAVISPPNDIEAKNLGYTMLADVAKALGGYQASVYAVKKSWAATREKEIVAWMRGLIAGHDYVFANKADSIAVLKSRVKNLSDADAETIYASLVNPDSGLNRKAVINEAGLKAVLNLRGEYGTPKKALGDASKYIDLSYHKKALAGM